MLQDPYRPCLAHQLGNELVPQIDQLIDVHLEADIFGGAFAEDLPIANAVLTEVEVVGLRSSTPTDVKHEPAGLRRRRIVVVG